MIGSIQDLCTPAVVFFIIVAFHVIQRAQAWIEHDLSFFLFKVAYLILWTALVQSVCRKGHEDTAWILVILPFASFGMFKGLFSWYEAKHAKERKQQ